VDDLMLKIQKQCELLKLKKKKVVVEELEELRLFWLSRFYILKNKLWLLIKWIGNLKVLLKID